MDRLTIIGSSHIAAESIHEIQASVRLHKPDIIAVELDRRRYYGLMSNEKPRIELSQVRTLGFAGFLFLVIGSWLQKRLGSAVGIAPGSEMKEAICLAKEQKAQLALIDQPLEYTMRRFSQEFSWKERLRLVWDVLTGAFTRGSSRISASEIDLRKVPSKRLIRKVLTEVKIRYPGLYRALVSERNEFMANKLVALLRANPEAHVLAVVGAGHEEELLKLVEKGMGQQGGVSYQFSVGG